MTSRSLSPHPAGSQRSRAFSVGLDPRTRFALMLPAIAAVIMLETVPELAVAYLSVVALIVWFGSARKYLRWLRLPAVPAIILFALVLYAFDLGTASAAALRLLALTSVFFAFMEVTRPEDLSDALVQSGVPYQAAFVVRAALQFVPVLSRTAAEVFDAQRARGLPLDRGVRSLVHYPALFAPLLVQSFRLADQLAEAMESRGFGRAGRSFRVVYRMRARDWAALIAAIGGLLALILLR